MAANVTSGQLQKLEALESGFRTDHSSDGIVTCHIVHKKSGEWWCSGTGYDEQSAIEQALSNAGSAERPRTVADIAKENEELKLQIAAQKASGEAKPRPARSKPAPKKPDNPVAVEKEPAEAKPLPEAEPREDEKK